MPRTPGLPALRPLAAAVDWLARRPWRASVTIFILSLSIQGVLLSKVPEQWVRPDAPWELPSVALSLATTGRFADPFAVPTGPTAHLPPLPPAIYGTIYWLLGPTATAGYVAWFSDMATYSVLWALLPWLATRVGLSRQAGVLAGLAGAAVPRWPGHGEALAAVALGLLMVAFARRWSEGGGTRAGAFRLGVAAGAAFHVQPALLSVVIGWLAFEVWWSRGPRAWVRPSLVALGIVLACLPWTWRNYQAFQAWFFIRSNFGLELRMGNHDGAAVTMDEMDRQPQQRPLHPRALEGEAMKLRAVGEAVYMQRAGREALDWMAQHPATFAGLTARRAVAWWFGPFDDPPLALTVTLLTLLALVGAWRTWPSLAVPDRAALLIPPVSYPLVYYVVAYMPRYREPVDWLFLLAAGAALWRWMAAGDEPAGGAPAAATSARRDGQSSRRSISSSRAFSFSSALASGCSVRFCSASGEPVKWASPGRQAGATAAVSQRYASRPALTTLVDRNCSTSAMPMNGRNIAKAAPISGMKTSSAGAGTRR